MATTDTSAMLDYYKTQIIQTIFGILLTLFNTYAQIMITNIIDKVVSMVNNAQNTYLDHLTPLYNLSLAYADGIIPINGDSFMVNLALVDRLMNVDKLTNKSSSVSNADIIGLLTNVKNSIGKEIEDRVCLLTLADLVLSVTIPYAKDKLQIKLNNSIYRQDGIDIIVQLPYIYMFDQARGRAYIFKVEDKSIKWFFMKDNKGFTVEMSDSSFMVGNKEFVIESAAQGGIVVSDRILAEKDPRKISY